MNRRLLLILGLLAVGTTLAQAHAFLDSAEPAVGSTIKTSPLVVKIWFTRELKQQGSNIEVINASGTEVDLKASTVDPQDRFLMTIGLPPLRSGRYTVQWNAVCRSDKHHTTGSYTFEVAK